VGVTRKIFSKIYKCPQNFSSKIWKENIDMDHQVVKCKII